MLRSIVLLSSLALVLAGCQDESGVSEMTVMTLDTTTTTTTDESTTSTVATTTTAEGRATTTTTVPVQLGDELVFNGDFSDGDETPSGWELMAEDSAQSVSVVPESGEKHISFFSPLEEGLPWPEARSTVPFEVDPHTDYRLAVDLRSVTEGRLFMALIFLDEDGDEILLRGPGEPDIASSDWETFNATLESPAEAASAYLVMRLAIRPDLSDADSFSVDVNSVSIKKVVG